MTMGMIFYCENNTLKTRKEFERETAMREGEIAAIKRSPILEETKTVGLDYRLQSIDGIIGYLDQSVKMDHTPENLTPIVLYLAKEMKKIRDGK
jgi:hypothetical protein